MIADHLSNEEVEDIKEMFRMMDTDNDGIVSHDELKSGLAKFGSHLMESEVQMLIEAVSIFYYFTCVHEVQPHIFKPKFSASYLWNGIKSKKINLFECFSLMSGLPYTLQSF